MVCAAAVVALAVLLSESAQFLQGHSHKGPAQKYVIATPAVFADYLQKRQSRQPREPARFSGGSMEADTQLDMGFMPSILQTESLQRQWPRWGAARPGRLCYFRLPSESLG